jgi:gliding motility-associated-like protein
MKKLSFFFALIFFATTAFSQNEGNIWFFGNGYGLDFSSTPPTLTTGSGMDAPEGCASLCDANGNLLFYSNGGGRVAPSTISGGIWNRNNQLMHDMMGLQGGGLSAPQSSIILPFPGNPGQYYLFTMEEIEFDVDGLPEGQEQGRGFSYFIVDMNANGGLGAVTVQDVNVHVPSYQSLGAVRHANGTDYWIIIVDYNTENFFVYTLNQSGLSTPTLKQRAFNNPVSQSIKIAPDGSKLTEDGVLYNFNANNGNITSPRLLIPGGTYSASFSHNSRYLYLVDQQGFTAVVKRFDTQSNDILASEEVLFTETNTLSGQMQLAPDGKIYWMVRPINTPDLSYIHTIDCPNSANPTVAQQVFTVAHGAFPSGGLPNFTDHIFLDNTSYEVELGEDRILDCTTGPIVLDAGNAGSEFLWSTGATTQTIQVIEEGTYSVEVTTDCGVIADTVFIAEDNPVPALAISGNSSVCPGDTTVLTAATNEIVQYNWSTGDTTATLTVTQSGIYGITVTDLCGGTNSDSLEVLFLDRERITFDGPSAVCEGSTIMLSASSPGATSFLWSDGSTEASINIDTGGTYQLTITNACESIDSSFIVEQSPLPSVEIISSATLCPGETKILESAFENVERYEWSTGQSIPNIRVADWQLFALEGSNECGTSRDSIFLLPTGCENCIYVPNAFSPNGDGRNDQFMAVPVCPLESFHLQVYSRWGALIFESNDPGEGWDGTFRGEQLNPDHFTWILEYTQAEQEFIREGSLVLIK